MEKRKSHRRSRALLLSSFAALALCITISLETTDGADDDRTRPAYSDSGELLYPAGYEQWTFVGSSFGLSYSERAPGENLHHVYLEPSAYQEYVTTGHFPDGTMLALEIYSAGARVAPSRGGTFPGELLALEFAVKDPDRFADSWAYFDFSDQQRSARPFPSSSCHRCHLEHAQSDNVFTQFYPRLRQPPDR